MPNNANDRTAAALPNYSIVMPVYNAARTLAPTIDAILRLNPRPVQIYLVDDGSTDGSPNIARRYSAVTCVALNMNRGPSYARNVGAHAAQTELLLMIDSDCYIDPQGFQRAYERISAEPGLAGIMGVPVRDTPGGPFAGVFKNYWYHLEFQAWGDPPRTLYGSCFLMRRKAYISVGGFDESFGKTPCEDAEFYFRLVQAGHRFERRMDFKFVHDKRMTTRQLLRTSFARSVSIIRNMHGKLGKSGNPWRLREKVLWAVEIGAGSLAIVLAPVALGAAAALGLGAQGPERTMAAALVVGWLLSLCAFLTCVRDKIIFALRDKNLAFATKALIYRMLEMPAVALGIIWGTFARRDRQAPGER